MPLFEAYIVVDWSARSTLSAKKPSAEAVWVGELTPPLDQRRETYFRSRRDCFHFIVERLQKHFSYNHRVLLGFDFSYGYPQGIASALNLPADKKGAWWEIWSELSARIKDAGDNTNNRFAVASGYNRILGTGNGGPFWGLPVGQRKNQLHPYSPGFPFKTSQDIHLERLRTTEVRLGQVQEAWKLYGAGSVGSQTLVGIPYLYRLRRHAAFAARSAVWPFETNFTPAPAPGMSPYIVHTEIWPGIVRDAVASITANQDTAIKDQIQVRTLCRWVADLDQNKELGRLFDVPKGLDEDQIRMCIEHEGWILGAT